MICRTGSPYYPQDPKRPTGEFDTHGTILGLLDAFPDQVVYYGTVKGKPPAGLHVVTPNMSGIDYEASSDEIDERCRPSEMRLREFGVKVCVNLSGYTGTWSWPDNDNAARLTSTSVRSAAPQLRAMHNLNLPRIVVISDPKCYPKDGEMARMWPSIRPIALLSQEQRSWKRCIQGVDFMQDAVHAKCEFWGVHGYIPPVAQKTVVVATAANTHFTEARLPRGRDDMWWDVLGDWLPRDLRICGKGWESYSEQWPDKFVGVVPSFTDALEVIGHGLFGPVVTQVEGFTSTKIRLHALMGSCPLPYDVSPYRYDSACRYFAANSPSRIRNEPDRLARAIERCEQGEIDRILDITTPDFSVLTRCVSALLDGKKPYAGWEFGGYWPC